MGRTQMGWTRTGWARSERTTAGRIRRVTPGPSPEKTVHKINKELLLLLFLVDIAVWGGVLVVAAYAMGTLYERNQRHLKELKDGYEGMLVILQQFLCNQKNSEADSYRLSSHAIKIAEALGLDPESTEDLRTAALLSKVNEIGISNEILYKAANLSEEELEKGMRKAANRGA